MITEIKYILSSSASQCIEDLKLIVSNLDEINTKFKELNIDFDKCVNIELLQTEINKSITDKLV